MFFQQTPATPLNVLGLIAEKTGGPNIFLQLRTRSIGEIRDRRIFIEQGRGYLINPLIGALGGKNRGNQQLPGSSMFQGRGGFGVFLTEDFHGFGRPAAASSQRFPGHRVSLQQAISW
jgi:hypothetical protein